VAANLGDARIRAAAQIVVRVSWTPQAISDLERIRAYVEQFNPPAATKLAERLYALGESLRDFPDRGARLANDRRQLETVWPYILYYQHDGAAVRILGIRHGARDRV
jgi:toxin ParE1/3/4